MIEEAAQSSFEEHADFLRAVGYRMLGSAADAEDLVQDTFVRLLERPPPATASTLRPWLTRVAMNLARDRLRARQRRSYVGPWLPSPMSTPEPPEHESAAPTDSPDQRHDRMESFTYAFLVALEVLTPTQRAVLILRDVLDHTVQESAEMLDLSGANVKTTLHRARKAMASYEAKRATPLAERRRLARAALERFLVLVATGDQEGLTALLKEDARLTSDGGGVYLASRRPVLGAIKIARTYIKLFEKALGTPTVELCWMNDMPALRIDNRDAPAGHAPRIVIRVETDEHGRIQEMHSILAPDKLCGLEHA